MKCYFEDKDCPLAKGAFAGHVKDLCTACQLARLNDAIHDFLKGFLEGFLEALKVFGLKDLEEKLIAVFDKTSHGEQRGRGASTDSFVS